LTVTTTTTSKEAQLVGLVNSVSGQDPQDQFPAYAKGEQVRIGVWDNKPTADEAYYSEGESSMLPSCDFFQIPKPILKGKGFVVTNVP
jgi:hypothetical protein